MKKIINIIFVFILGFLIYFCSIEENKINKQNKQNKKITTNLKKCDKNNFSLNNELEELKKQIEEKNKEIEEKDNQIQELRNENSNLVQEIERLRKN